MDSVSTRHPRKGEFFLLEPGAISGPACGVVFENLDRLLSPPRMLWLPEDGGQLRMFLADGAEPLVEPLAGCLVVFLSGEVPHEVLPAGRERLSLTGGFRRRGKDPV